MYDSLATFYADPARWRSSERDVGLRWRDDEGVVYRAAWVRDTGELYAARLVTGADEPGDVEVLARVETRPALERAFEGWQDVCGLAGSYEWLRCRARMAAAARQSAADTSPRELSRSYLPGARLGPSRARASRGGYRRPATLRPSVL
jgi:hypothetical protein